MRDRESSANFADETDPSHRESQVFTDLHGIDHRLTILDSQADSDQRQLPVACFDRSV